MMECGNRPVRLELPRNGRPFMLHPVFLRVCIQSCKCIPPIDGTIQSSFAGAKQTSEAEQQKNMCMREEYA